MKVLIKKKNGQELLFKNTRIEREDGLLYLFFDYGGIETFNISELDEYISGYEVNNPIGVEHE